MTKAVEPNERDMNESRYQSTRPLTPNATVPQNVKRIVPWSSTHQWRIIANMLRPHVYLKISRFRARGARYPYLSIHKMVRHYKVWVTNCSSQSLVQSLRLATAALSVYPLAVVLKTFHTLLKKSFKSSTNDQVSGAVGTLFMHLLPRYVPRVNTNKETTRFIPWCFVVVSFMLTRNVGEEHRREASKIERVLL